MKKICPICLVFVAGCLAIMPNANAYRHVTIDAYGVVAASKKLDINKIEILDRRFHKHKYAGIFSSAFHYMNFDLTKSKYDAKSCFDRRDDGTKVYISVHLMCGEMVARIYYMNSKYAKWAKLMTHYNKEIVPKFWQRVPEADGIPIGIMGTIKYSDFINWPPVRVNSIPGSKHVEDIKWGMGDNSKGNHDEQVPFIEINVNGVSVKAVVDTQASITTIPFSMARDLGLRHISMVSGGVETMYRRILRLGLVRADTLDVAGFRFNNAMISVADVDVPVLGLVQLIKLHRIQLDQNKFRVISKYDNNACTNRMYLGGGLTGPPQIIKMAAKINGEVKHPVLDTGFGGTFHKTVHYIRNGLGDKILAHDAAGDKKVVGYGTYATISAGDRNERIRGSVVLYKKRQAVYRFGAQLIKKIGPLYLDFDSGYACFLKE